jgi:hypothetical protein
VKKIKIEVTEKWLLIIVKNFLLPLHSQWLLPVNFGNRALRMAYSDSDGNQRYPDWHG